MTDGLARLSRAQLAVLVPELLLAGHLIDRAGLAPVLGVLGPDGMRDVAIAEWMGASPVYTPRMQRSLDFVGDDVPTIFKGLQLDIGAPPQFMDFRYVVHDRDHGEFRLAHCGALMDVEPMGPDYVRSMCHDIEDPTFDATAIATNPKAVMRPVHRPPRTPADRTPHCAWTVTIDPANDAPPYPEAAHVIGRTRAATFTGVTTIDPAEDGFGDYRAPLWADVPFHAFSRSALIRIAEEVCLQGHLLAASYRLALSSRVGPDEVRRLSREQFTGVAAVVAGRLRTALGLGGSVQDALTVLGVHPAFTPAGYVEVDHDGASMIFRRSLAHEDGAWVSLLDGDDVTPLGAMLHSIDPALVVDRVHVDGDALRVDIASDPAAAGRREDDAVAVTRISTGAAFVLAERRALLPIVNG